MSQDFFKFETSEPRFLREHRSRPVPRPPKVRQAPLPKRPCNCYTCKVNKERKLPIVKNVPSVFKPWPARCPKTFWLCFESEKEAKAWIAQTNGSVYKVWRCVHCFKFHIEAYPVEISGTTSGKANRKWHFLARKGVPAEKIYDLKTSTTSA